MLSVSQKLIDLDARLTALAAASGSSSTVPTGSALDAIVKAVVAQMGGAAAAREQVEVHVVSPQELMLPIAKTSDFKLPEVEVLKLTTSKSSVAATQSFTPSDVNYDASKLDVVDGKLVLRTSVDVLSGDWRPVGTSTAGGAAGYVAVSAPVTITDAVVDEVIPVNQGSTTATPSTVVGVALTRSALRTGLWSAVTPTGYDVSQPVPVVSTVLGVVLSSSTVARIDANVADVTLEPSKVYPPGTQSSDPVIVVDDPTALVVNVGTYAPANTTVALPANQAVGTVDVQPVVGVALTSSGLQAGRWDQLAVDGSPALTTRVVANEVIGVSVDQPKLLAGRWSTITTSGSPAVTVNQVANPILGVVQLGLARSNGLWAAVAGAEAKLTDLSPASTKAPAGPCFGAAHLASGNWAQFSEADLAG